jgi:hypothetical protein
MIPLTIQLFIYLHFEDLPGCGTIYLDGMLPMLWRNLLIPSSFPEDGDMQVPLKRF